MGSRLKTDENLPSSAVLLLRGAGHDVATVLEEGLSGASDPRVTEVCRSESRALITLDRGLGNIRAYPPTEYHGIVVLRPTDQSLEAVLILVRVLIEFLETSSLAGALWILEEKRFRIRR